MFDERDEVGELSGYPCWLSRGRRDLGSLWLRMDADALLVQVGVEFEEPEQLPSRRYPVTTCPKLDAPLYVSINVTVPPGVLQQLA